MKGACGRRGEEDMGTKDEVESYEKTGKHTCVVRGYNVPRRTKELVLNTGRGRRLGKLQKKWSC